MSDSVSDFTGDPPAPSISLPVTGAESGQALSFDRIAAGLILLQILGATLLQKLAVPIGGVQLYAQFFLIVFLTGFGFFSRRLSIQPARAILYLVMIACLSLGQILGNQAFSVLSLLLLFAMHLPYVFCLKPGHVHTDTPVRIFQTVMIAFSIIGILQYCLQYVVGAAYAFPMESLLPQSFIIRGFHGLNPTHYNSGIYKSTAVFFLEPAIFCQFLAVAIIIEMAYFKNPVRAAVYLFGIAFTFSGTGLIILIILGPVYLAAHRRFLWLAAMFVVLITAGLWAPLLGLETTYNRVFEILDPSTSGFARFLSMFYLLRDLVWPSAQAMFFGLGAGAINDAPSPGILGYETFDPSWGKLLYEYGLFGFVAYLPLISYVFWKSPASPYVKAALIIQFFILGEYVLAPTVHGVILALLAWLPPAGGRELRKTEAPGILPGHAMPR